MPHYKLGKLPPKYNRMTLTLGDYIGEPVDIAKPAKLWREFKIPEGSWGMYGNDTAGDCTVASKAHQMMMMTAHTGKMFVPDPQDIMNAYIALTGYDPATGANDTGCAMTDVLEYWKTTGIAGHKILGWAQVDYANIEEVKMAMYLFGAVDIGVQFPAKAMDQFNAGQAWSVLADDGGIEGGHDVPIFGYGSVGDSCVTWGKRQEMTWDWFTKYCDEAYAVITNDWIGRASLVAPNGFDLPTLTADLSKLS